MTNGYCGSSRRQRGLATVLVGGIHAALAAVLVFGMPGVAMEPIRERALTGINIPLTPHGGDGAGSAAVPEGIIVPRGERAEPQEPASPPEPVEWHDNGVISCLFWFGPIEDHDSLTADDVARLHGSDAPRTTSPRPAGDPSSWFGPQDVPVEAGALLADWMSYRLTVGTNGRVSHCEVLRSSFNAMLDQAVCDKLARRAHFEPALDWAGNRVIGTYAGTVRWDLPD